MNPDTFLVFYCFYGSRETIKANAAKPMDKVTIGELLGRFRRKKDFIGLIDARDTTLQVYKVGNDKYWVEIPVVADKGSYGQHMTMAELKTLISAIPTEFAVAAFPSFEFEAW